MIVQRRAFLNKLCPDINVDKSNYYAISLEPQRSRFNYRILQYSSNNAVDS